VGLALFNGPYPLKPSGVSGAGVTGGGSGSRALHDYPTRPPPQGGCLCGCSSLPSCSCSWAGHPERRSIVSPLRDAPPLSYGRGHHSSPVFQGGKWGDQMLLSPQEGHIVGLSPWAGCLSPSAHPFSGHALGHLSSPLPPRGETNPL